MKTISGSITTTMSICSVVTGYSRDMGRDLVWKEGTTHRKLTRSWQPHSGGIGADGGKITEITYCDIWIV